MNLLTTARNLAESVRKKQVSAMDVASFYLERLEALNPKLNAFLSWNADNVRDQARALDAKIARGESLGKLAGVPIAIKDNLCVAGMKTTCASKILENYVAPYSATVIEKLQQADAIILGKTNLDEFAMGSSTENSAFGRSMNPWDLARVPGGSSGGSAVAVAARMAPLALGSDTGGSIRQPASFCGVVGLKPTYGRVSRYGLIAFASSLDQVGTFAQDAEDSALALSVIAGEDPKDATSMRCAVQDYGQELQSSAKGLKIGLAKEYFVAGLDEEIRQNILSVAEFWKNQGAEIVEISLPHTELAVEVYYILAPSEASANLARFDGVRYGYRSDSAKNLRELYEKSRNEGFGPEVKRRIMLGTYALSSGYYDAYYAKAQKVRRLIHQDFLDAFEKVDAVLTPTSPTVAFSAGEKVSDPLAMYLSDIFTISCNLAGVPGISFPSGLSKEKLPIGAQVLGRPFEESTLLRLVRAYEAATNDRQFVPAEIAQ